MLFSGYLTGEKCDNLPVQKCTVEKKTIKKLIPSTSNCVQIPQNYCAQEGCGFKEVKVLNRK